MTDCKILDTENSQSKPGSKTNPIDLTCNEDALILLHEDLNRGPLPENLRTRLAAKMREHEKSLLVIPEEDENPPKKTKLVPVEYDRKCSCNAEIGPGQEFCDICENIDFCTDCEQDVWDLDHHVCLRQ